MHINFDEDKVEVKDIFEPKKSVKKSSDDDFFGGATDNSSESIEEDKKDDFFGDTSSSDDNSIKINERPRKEAVKEVVVEKIEKEDSSIEMEKYIDELKTGLDKIHDESQSLKLNCQNLRDENKNSFESVKTEIKTEIEKVKGQVKGYGEEIKSELDGIKDNIKHSAQDVKLSLSKAKLDIIEDEKKDIIHDKKAMFSKKASMDSLFRVVFLLIILTLATVVYFGITIMDDFNKSITSLDEKIVDAGVINKSLAKNSKQQTHQQATVSQNIDTSKFENEARVIKNQISNLTRNINDIKNILDVIKNQQQSANNQAPRLSTIEAAKSLPIVPTVAPAQISKVEFDDSNLNEKLNRLSKDLENITAKLNSINSKVRAVSKDMKSQTKVVVNKLDRVNIELKKKIDEKEVNPVKIYPDGLQIRKD